jgi:apolipoprotein N-acyltransferase
LIHGLAAWLTAIPWIAGTLETYGGLPGAVAFGLLLLLAVYLALFHALFAALGARLWRRGGGLDPAGLKAVDRTGLTAVALTGLPALWVALEWLRTHLLTGFPWNLAAYAWADVAGALPLTAWIGSFGLSGLLVFANTGLALAIRGVPGRRWQPAAAGLLVPLLLLAAGGRWAGPGGPDEEAPGPPARPLPVRVVQPNIPNLVAWDPARVAANYARLLALSRRACDEPGTLLVWPESAAWPYLFGRDPRLEEDLEVLAAAGCPVLFNSVVFDGDEAYNSALLFGRGGLAGRADKRHLVPFGEYVLFGDALPFVESLARQAGDFTPGREVALLPWDGARIGVSVCFEITFPGEVAELARSGASLLVTITNDAWFGDTAAPWQHFRAGRFRAAENHRPVIRAAITGVSGVIGPDGAVREILGVGEEGVIAARVVPRRQLTPFSRAPWLVPAASAVWAAAALLLASGGRARLRKSWRRPRPPAPEK